MPAVEPIEIAIRRVSRALAEAEWSNAAAKALRTELDALLAARKRGERYAVPF